MKNKKQFIAQSNTIAPITIPEGLLIDEIPAAVYTVKLSDAGFYLELTKNRFDDQPSKLYGSTHQRAGRIQHVYEHGTSSVGVLFTGLKGAGKSLLMKEVANNMIDKGLPVVIIANNFQGPSFMSFMNDLGECVVLLDEFGKTYKKDNQDGNNEQDSLLTFFDGVYSAKRLILLAENSTWDISDLFLDRPSRVMFHWKYDRLEEDVVDGFCADNLDNVKLLPDIKMVYQGSKDFTFDSLKALVSQCNMFPGIDFQEIVDGLNIPLKSASTSEIVSFEIDGKDAMKRLDVKNSAIHNSDARLVWYLDRPKDKKKELKGQPFSQKTDQRDSMHMDSGNFVSQIDNIITYHCDSYNMTLKLKVAPAVAYNANAY